VRLPEAAGDELRVLLVICRPGGRDDVPFRSVASRLVRGGADQMEGLSLEVLRPATFPRLAEVLHQAADAGRPYHVVHFDGHGDYLDVAAQPADQDGGGGGGPGMSPLRYGISVAGPVREGPHGYLIFEDPASPANRQLADGPALGRLLTATGVPVLVLNACRSAYTEAPSRPAETDAAAAADVHARIRAYGSLAAEVADAGVPGVVAMRYNVYVVTAAQYMADLYAHLLSGKSLGRAATAARRALANDPTRHIGAVPMSLQDYSDAGDTRRALHHYQQSIKFKEARDDIYGAGRTRYNIALLLQAGGRPGDALLYARAALHDFERTGPGAAQDAADARDLITELEQATG